MAQADRKYTGDVTVLTLGGIAIVTMFKNCTLRVFADMMEARAAKDAWRYRKTRISNWEIELGKVIEIEGAITSMAALFATAFAITFTTAASGGRTFTGTTVMREYNEDHPGEDSEETITCEGQGALTVAYTP